MDPVLRQQRTTAHSDSDSDSDDPRPSSYLPITSSYAPSSSFFRPRRPRALSTSSVSSTSSLSSSSSSSSSLSSLSLQPRPTFSPARASTTPKRHLKLSLSLLRARRALSTNSFEPLSAALKSVSLALPTELGSLGSFVPILDRLARDLVEGLGGEEMGRQARRTLSKEDAKALVGLRQRWSGKGKGREADSWVTEVRERVLRNPPSTFLEPPHDLATSTLLTSLESLILPSSLPRISLSELGLTSEYVTHWKTFERAEEVLAWYISFEIAPQLEPRAVLDSVRSLDLSKNQLDTLPTYLRRVLPLLETLLLTHNLLSHLPPLVTLLPLRRLKTHGNPLSHSSTKPTTKSLSRLLASIPPIPPPDIPPLSELCARVLRSSPTLDLENLDLPPHLHTLLTTSYTCASCTNFISSLSPSYLPPLFERVHLLEPGVSLPRQISHDPTSLGEPTEARTTQRLTIEEKVLLALLGRGVELMTFVVGDEKGWRFCRGCMGGHLGLREEGEGEEAGGGKEERRCGCMVCAEERRVKESSEGVMRWLRRKGGKRGLGWER